MSHRALVMLVVLGLFACAGVHRPMHVAAAAPRERAERSDDALLPEAVARNLVAAVEKLGERQSAQSRGLLSRAARALADAIEAIPPGAPLAAQRIRERADRLAEDETNPLGGVEHADEVITPVLEVLTRVTPPRGRFREYTAALNALRGAHERIPSGASIASVFRAATDAVLVATGGEPPFGEAIALEDAPAQSGKQPFAARVHEASAAVHTLGQTTWTDATAASAEALLALAHVFEGEEGKSGKMKDRVAEVRFQAERLRRTEWRSFGQAGWVRQGLLASLDGLELLAGSKVRELSPWLETARTSARGIDEGRAFAFQRAALQDAFRATSDAFTFAAGAMTVPTGVVP